ncbi:hypothetical protein [Paenibacillus sp. NPDC058177]|uniref:hypothetical protein n=1 Tax=Paenibacillus sp. NPDC058177 TaxID=3346369 RepID=UPI0036DC5116
MSQANIPNITPQITLTRDEVINLILSSIAMQELGLSHIINTEAEKIQFALGTLPGGSTTPATFPEIIQINQNVRETLKEVVKTEWVLQNKMDSLKVFLGPESGVTGPTGSGGGPTSQSYANLAIDTQCVPPLGLVNLVLPAPSDLYGLNFNGTNTITVVTSGLYYIDWVITLSSCQPIPTLFSLLINGAPFSGTGGHAASGILASSRIGLLFAGDTIQISNRSDTQRGIQSAFAANTAGHLSIVRIADNGLV